MRLLVLAYYVPATSNMPGSPRLFNICKELCSEHQIYLATFARPQEKYQCFINDVSVKSVFQDVFILPQAPMPSRWGKLNHWFHSRGAHFATQYHCPHYHHALREMIRNLANKAAVDVVYVDGLEMAQYVEANEKMPAFLDLHGSMTLLFSRTTKLERNPWKKFECYIETRRVAKWEKSVRKLFPLIIANSKFDEAFLRKLDPLVNILTITNGVDIEYFSVKQRWEFSEKLIFFGVMNYGPNEDAVTYFCDEVFPLILRQCPNAEFWVVGKDPPPRVQSLSERPGVRVTGGVDDIRPYVESAGIFVCPLRYGSGVKNKILVAMAMQRPVVSTSIGVEGLEVQDNQDLLIADTPADFAAKVIYLLRNPDSAKCLGQKGQNLVRDRYSWRSKAGSLEDALMSLLSTKKP